MEINPERLNTIQQYVQSQIILQFLYQMWLLNILLHNVTFSLGRVGFTPVLNFLDDPLDVPRDEDSSSLGEGVWLTNEVWPTFLTV
jgi:hypothetical protein